MSRARARDEAILREYEESNYKLYNWTGDGKHRAPSDPRKARAVMVLVAAFFVSLLPSAMNEPQEPRVVVAESMQGPPIIYPAPPILDREIERPSRDFERQPIQPPKTEVAAKLTVVAKPKPKKPKLSRAQIVIRYALAQVGDQYRWGAAGPNSWDCSGLVMKAFAKVGIKLPHYSGSMLKYGKRVSKKDLRPGDIVWPHSGHVAIYLGNNKIVHASNPRTDVKVGKLYSFWTARRLL